MKRKSTQSRITRQRRRSKPDLISPLRLSPILVPSRGNSFFSIAKSILFSPKIKPPTTDPRNDSKHPSQTLKNSTISPIPNTLPSESVRYKEFLSQYGNKASFSTETFEQFWTFLQLSQLTPQHSKIHEKSSKLHQYTHINPSDHWDWAYNTQSGLHPAYPFFINAENSQRSHFYTYPTPSTPTPVQSVAYHDIYPHEQLIGVKGVDFRYKGFYNRHMYKGGSINYYSPVGLNQNVSAKHFSSIDSEHKFGQNRKNLIDYTIASSQEHIITPRLPNNKSTMANDSTNSMKAHPNSLTQHIPHSIVQLDHILYNHTQQSELIKLSPHPVVTRYKTPSHLDSTLDINQAQLNSGANASTQIEELKKDKHDIHLTYKVTGETINLWSKLTGNTNKLTLDERYAKEEGFPSRIVPLQLLTTLALDGLHVTSKLIAPHKPVLMDALDDVLLETRFEGFVLGYLSHLQDEARANNQNVPDSLSEDQFKWAEREFKQELGGNKNIPWHLAVQSLRSFVFDSTRPIYLPVENNFGMNESGSLDSRHQQPTVYLDFYAQILKDNLNHDDYNETVMTRMNDCLDLTDYIQNKYNPIINHHPTSQANNSSNSSPQIHTPYKRITIRKNKQGGVYTPFNEDKQRDGHYKGPHAHEWDVNNRIYLDNDDILSSIVHYEDVLRDKPAYVKTWFTVRYDNPYSNNDQLSSDVVDVNSTEWIESAEKCFLGLATFHSPWRKSYGTLSEVETSHSMAFIQGIEIINDNDDEDDVGKKSGVNKASNHWSSVGSDASLGNKTDKIHSKQVLENLFDRYQDYNPYIYINTSIDGAKKETKD